MENKIQTIAHRSFSQRQLPRRLFSLTFLIGLLAAASIIAATSSTSTRAAIAPQASITGEWTAELPKDRADKIYLSLNRRTAKGRTNMSGSDISLAELQGLTREQALNANTNVKFRLVREAGTFEFEGTFRDGKGAGFWTLVPSQSFISEMRGRGFDNLTEEQLIASAMLDVKIKAIDDLKAVGFNRLSIEDVFKATIFKITPEYISELKSLGYENLGLEELVKARIFKIDAAFAREVGAMGYEHQSLESLVKMRIFKVTPEFLGEMRSAGLENLSIEDLVKLRIFKIDSDFIQRAKASGRTDLDVEELVRMRIHNNVK